MRLPFVSAATYDWAIRAAERHLDEAEREAARADRANEQAQRFFGYLEDEMRKVRELTDIIVDMRKQNFVVDVPITSTPLSVDEADEYAVAEEEARPALLKRKLV